MRESQIEQKLTEKVKAKGGASIKLVSPSSVGLPDRLVLLPGGKLGFVELKAPGKKPRQIQIYWLEKLRALGFFAEVVDSLEGIDPVLEKL